MYNARILLLVRWVTLLGLTAVALLYLNGAFYAAWLSGGPPTPNPTGWKLRAIGQLCFSAAAFLAAFGCFFSLAKLPSLSRTGTLLLLVAACSAVAPYIGRSVIAQSCADRGGHWSNLTLECEK